MDVIALTNCTSGLDSEQNMMFNSVCAVVLVTAAAQAFIGYLRDIKSGAAGSRESQKNDAATASVNVRALASFCRCTLLFIAMAFDTCFVMAH